jgi:hypothetical protein
MPDLFWGEVLQEVGMLTPPALLVVADGLEGCVVQGLWAPLVAAPLVPGPSVSVSVVLVVSLSVR